MAQIFTIKVGGRGRPLKIDPEKMLEQFMKQLPKARQRLAEFREKTSGVRDINILGSETLLPKSIRATADVLEALQEGKRLNLESARELRQNLLVVRQLASKQERVYSRALASALIRQYEQDIEFVNRTAGKFARQQRQKTLKRLKSATPRQQQKFFLSRGYQSPKTSNVGSDLTSAKAWAENDYKKKTGQEISMTGQEALAYIEADKAEREFDLIEAEEMSNAFDEMGF